MPTTWDPAEPGVLALPSGRLVRGRGLGRAPLPGPDPEFGLYFLRRPPSEMPWESCWIRWPDLWVPTDRDAARRALNTAWRRSSHSRVEIACRGGIGRTGTGLACLAVIDGLPHEDAIVYVREHYHPRAVQTPWQRRFVHRFPSTPPQ